MFDCSKIMTQETAFKVGSTWDARSMKPVTYFRRELITEDILANNDASKNWFVINLGNNEKKFKNDENWDILENKKHYST